MVILQQQKRGFSIRFYPDIKYRIINAINIMPSLSKKDFNQ